MLIKMRVIPRDWKTLHKEDKEIKKLGSKVSKLLKEKGLDESDVLSGPDVPLREMVIEHRRRLRLTAAIDDAWTLYNEMKSNILYEYITDYLPHIAFEDLGLSMEVKLVEDRINSYLVPILLGGIQNKTSFWKLKEFFKEGHDHKLTKIIVRYFATEVSDETRYSLVVSHIGHLGEQKWKDIEKEIIYGDA